MKKIFIVIFVLLSFIAKGQLVSFTYNGDTLKVVNPSTGVTSNITLSSPQTFSIGTVASTAPLTVANFSTSFPSPQTGTILHAVSNNTVNGRVSFDTYNNTSFTGSIFQGRRARGSAGAPTAAITDDILVALGGDGYGATGYHNISVGSIGIRSEGTMTDISAPTYMAFYTTPSGSITSAERMRIKGNGTINIAGLNSTGFVQTNGSGDLSTAALSSGNITTALGFTPQTTLVSGTNIKTINGTTILGSRDLTIATGVAWGAITGTLSNQTDLQTALDGKQASGSYLVTTNNLSDLSNTATARTNLGGTTVGKNLFTLTNPSAVTFPRFNADNTVTARTASQMLSDLGGQASGSYVLQSTTVNGQALSSNVTISTITGNAGTATALATGRTIGITGDVTWTSPSFDGSQNITATSTVTKINGTSLAALGTGILKNTTATGVPSIAVAGDFPTLNQNTTGSAATLTTPRAINGVNFDGSAAITVTAAAGTLSGNTLASGVVNSSLTSVGTLINLTVTNPISGSVTGNAGTVTTNANLTGPITSVGNATTISADAITTVKILDANVTLAKMANIATASLLGRNTAGTGVPEVLSTSTVRTLLSINNVDNTSDASKPVSTATQTALDLKANLASPAFTGTVTGITATMVGLGNVTNNAQLTIANNLSDLNNAATARTNLGGTTIGKNLFTLTNPSAVTFPRFNADNTVTSRTAAEMLSDLGAQASGSYVLQSTTVNGQALSSNVTISTITGNAGTATTLFTPRAINGVNFDGSAAITVTAAAVTLSGTTLASNVVNSSLATIGTITSGGLGTGAVIGGVTMTLGSDASYDLYYRNSSGILTRLANGTTGQVLQATTNAAPAWGTVSGSGLNYQQSFGVSIMRSF